VLHEIYGFLRKFGLVAAHRNPREWSGQGLEDVHCKKSLAVFSSPAGMSLTKVSLAGIN
jgi:hypothetical protein